MDYNRIMSMELVSDITEDIEARCGCIALKGVLHHYIYDNGYHSDMVEMTAPYPGKKRAFSTIRLMSLELRIITLPRL